MSKTAILVDGAFYQKRAEAIYGKQTPEEKVRCLMKHCWKHLTQKDTSAHELYRIFYYDCPPLDKKVRHPMTKETINYKDTDQYREGMEFLSLMRTERKVALRLGTIKGSGSDFVIPAYIVKKLYDETLAFDDLKPNQLKLDVRQKGVDMRIGVDIASLAYKKQVDQIVLIAGDSDFVPIAKVARREGIDFILDPMWNQVSPDLLEYIDGLTTQCKKPKSLLRRDVAANNEQTAKEKTK